jgi:hypothetical protein
MRRRLLLSALMLCALASVLFAPAASSTPSATCLVIGNGARFSTLQDAVSAAAPGDSLVVKGVCVGVATLDKSLHLAGAGGLGAAVLDGGNQNTVISILGGATVTITNLIIEHGSAQPPPCPFGPCPGEGLGGGIRNFGTVTLVHSIVRDNSATFGGGIANFSTFILINSSVTGNSAALGGGIWNMGTLTLINSTVSGNRSPLPAAGGGIYTGPTITLINSTVSGNIGGDCTGC